VIQRLEESGMTTKLAVDSLVSASKTHLILQIARLAETAGDVEFASLLQGLSRTGMDICVRDENNKDILDHFVKQNVQRALPTTLAVLLQLHPTWVVRKIPQIFSIVPKHCISVRKLRTSTNAKKSRQPEDSTDVAALVTLPSDIIRLILRDFDLEGTFRHRIDQLFHDEILLSFSRYRRCCMLLQESECCDGAKHITLERYMFLSIVTRPWIGAAPAQHCFISASSSKLLEIRATQEPPHHIGSKHEISP
jgi:hypothetical protein